METQNAGGADARIAELIEQLVEGAKTYGHHATLRETDDETIQYWADYVAANREDLTAAIAALSAVSPDAATVDDAMIARADAYMTAHGCRLGGTFNWHEFFAAARVPDGAGGKAVRWERKHQYGDWHDVSRELYEAAKTDPVLTKQYEFRALYAEPSLSREGASVSNAVLALDLNADDWNPYELLRIALPFVKRGQAGDGDSELVRRIEACIPQQKLRALATPNPTTLAETAESVPASTKKRVGMLRERDAEDAARWRALIGCARVRVLGSAGLRSDTDPNGAPYNGYAHIGLELWTKHEAGNSPFDATDWLTKYADIARGVLQSNSGAK